MLSSTLSTKFGFHTTYSTQISVTEPERLSRCTVHLFYILPSRIIVDPYELANYKESYTFNLSGTSNLELPVTGINSGGLALLLNILLPTISPDDVQNVIIDVPLHVRYGEPLQRSKSNDGTVPLPWPIEFWSCPSSSSRPSILPELMASFDPSTTFLPTYTNLHSESETIQAPIGYLADLRQVEMGTAAIILLAFAYLLHVSYRTASGINVRNANAKIE